MPNISYRIKSLLLCLFFFCAQAEPIRIVENLPLVPVTFGNTTEFLVLDLGAGQTCLAPDLLKKLPCDPLDEYRISCDIQGVKSTRQFFRFDSLIFGGQNLENVKLCEEPFETSHGEVPFALTRGRVGRDLLMGKVLWIDKKNSVFQLAKTPEDIPRFEERNWTKIPTEIDTQIGIILKLFNEKMHPLRLLLDTGSNVSLLHERCNNPHTLCIGTFNFIPFNLEEIGVDALLGFDALDQFEIIIDFASQQTFISSYFCK